MMRLFPGIISFLLLGAHSFRWGDGIGVWCWLSLLLLTFSGWGWARLVTGIALLGGVGVWGKTTIMLLQMRFASGLPWERLFWIMGGVTLFTFFSSLLLFGNRSERHFSHGREMAPAQALAFFGTTLFLTAASAKASFPLLLADRFLPGAGRLETLWLGFYASWLLGLLLSSTPTTGIRTWFWRLFSLVFFGQLVLGLVGFDRFLMTGTLHLPVPALILGGPIYRGEGLFMPILYLSTLLLVGGGWCAFLCYIGPWDDFAARQRLVPDRQLPRWRRWGRIATGLLTVLGALGMRRAGVSNGTAVLLAAGFGAIGLLIMAFVSRRTGAMIHCTGYCPIGLTSNILGRLSPFRISISSECDRCGACSPTCRYGALTAPDLEARKPGLPCTLCGDCLGACQRGRLSYAFPGCSAETARQAYLVLIVILHALFLGVARL